MVALPFCLRSMSTPAEPRAPRMPMNATMTMNFMADDYSHDARSGHRAAPGDAHA